MGFSVSYAAFRGVDANEGLSRLGFSEGEPSEFFLDDPITGGRLSSGWYLVFSNDPLTFADPARLAALSEGGEAVALVAIESTMSFYAWRFANGAERWAVSHDAQIGLEHLDATGDLPDGYDDIVAEMHRKQASDDMVDYFSEIPVELVRLATGFRYDGVDESFEREARLLTPR